MHTDFTGALLTTTANSHTNAAVPSKEELTSVYIVIFCCVFFFDHGDIPTLLTLQHLRFVSYLGPKPVQKRSKTTKTFGAQYTLQSILI